MFLLFLGDWVVGVVCIGFLKFCSYGLVVNFFGDDCDCDCDVDG